MDNSLETDPTRPTLAITRRANSSDEPQISENELNGLIAEGLVFLFSLLGIIFNSLGVSSCQLTTLGGGKFIEGGLGLFLVQPPDTEGCRGVRFVTEVTSDRYPGFLWNPNQDEVLAFAQVGGLLAIVLGIILVINITIRQFCKELKWYKLCVYLCGTAIQVCLGWVQLIWFSKGCDFFPCHYGSGTTFFLASHVFWCLAVILTGRMRPSKADRKTVALNSWTSQLRMQMKEREKSYQFEYLPVGLALLIMGTLLYLALHNINEV